MRAFWLVEHVHHKHVRESPQSLLHKTLYSMDLNILPGDALKHVVGYLLPRDVFNLSMSYPNCADRYRPLLIGSLHENLSRVMRSGRARFNSSDPLRSFIGMTAYSPKGSIVLRYVCVCLVVKSISSD